MSERHDIWGTTAPPRGYLPAPQARPAGFQGPPPRPLYREPHPIRAAQLLAGLAAGVLWCGLFAGLSHSLSSYAWWTIGSAISAWLVAGLLALIGDRGVATGVAISSGLSLSIAVVLVAVEWIQTYNWPLW